MHVSSMSTRRLRLGEMLLQQQVITQEQLDEALKIQKATGDRLGEILREKEYATEEQICYHLARQLGVPYMSLTSHVLPIEVVRLIPRDIAVKHNLVAIDKMGQFITIAMSDPLAQATRKQIAEITGLKVQFVVSTSDEISLAIERYYTPELEDNKADLLSEDTVEPESRETPLGVHVIDLEEPHEAIDIESPPEEIGKTVKKDKPAVISEHTSETSETDHTFEPPVKHDTPHRHAVDPNGQFMPNLVLTTFVFPEESLLLKAVQRICYEPDIKGDLLVVEGETGMGKTHLLHAMGNALIHVTPPRRIEYLDAREIVMRLEDARTTRQLCEEIHRELLEADMVLLDNWHQLATTPLSQILASILLENLLYEPVQVACALCPVENWSPENRSQLGSGLHFRLQMPDIAEKLRILDIQEKQASGESLPDTVLKEIAQQDFPNIRALIAHWKRQRFEILPLPHNMFSEGTPTH